MNKNDRRNFQDEMNLEKYNNENSHKNYVVFSKNVVQNTDKWENFVFLAWYQMNLQKYINEYFVTKFRCWIFKEWDEKNCIVEKFTYFSELRKNAQNLMRFGARNESSKIHQRKFHQKFRCRICKLLNEKHFCNSITTKI